jgi:RHS repeat-associated protein
VIFVYNVGGTLIAEYSTKLAEHAKVSYLTADHLGSPRIVTDEAGTVIARHDYLSFGDEVTDTLGSVAGRTPTQGYGTEDEIRKQYTGYEHDEESGLEYAQARYYNSKHGRFTSVDPLTASASIKNPQTFNRYSYVLNSPYKFTDPLGLRADSARDSKARGERGYNQELADFLDRNMVDASERQRATYQPANSPVVAHTTGNHHSSTVHTGNVAASGQSATPPASPPAQTQNGNTDPIGIIRITHSLLDTNLNKTDPNFPDSEPYTEYTHQIKIEVIGEDGVEVLDFVVETSPPLNAQSNENGTVTFTQVPEDLIKDSTTTWNGKIIFKATNRVVNFSFGVTEYPDSPSLGISNITPSDRITLQKGEFKLIPQIKPVAEPKFHCQTMIKYRGEDL